MISEEMNNEETRSIEVDIEEQEVSMIMTFEENESSLSTEEFKEEALKIEDDLELEDDIELETVFAFEEELANSEIAASLETMEDIHIELHEDDEEIKDAQQDLIDQVLKEMQAADSGYDLEGIGQKEKQENNVFEDQQKKYLVGKVTLKDIVTDYGHIIAKAGDLVTVDMIENAKAQGKLIEIIMNCR